MDADADAGGLGPAPDKRGRRLPLGFQVILAVVALLALLLGVAVLAVVLLIGVDHAARDGERSTPYGNAVATAALSAKGVANDERGYLLTGNHEFVREAAQRIHSAQSALAAAVDAAQTPAERMSAAHAQAGFEQWVDRVRADFTQFEAGHPGAAIAAAVGPNRALRKTYESSLASAQALGRSAEQSTASSLSHRSTESLWVLLICLAVALAGGIRIGYWLVRSVAVPIYRILSILHFDGAPGLPST